MLLFYIVQNQSINCSDEHLIGSHSNSTSSFRHLLAWAHILCSLFESISQRSCVFFLRSSFSTICVDIKSKWGPKQQLFCCCCLSVWTKTNKNIFQNSIFFLFHRRKYRFGMSRPKWWQNFKFWVHLMIFLKSGCHVHLLAKMTECKYVHQFKCSVM